MADDGFASFYASSYRRLLGQLFAVTGDLAEAENVLQEAYARAFVRWSRVGAYDLPEAWVRRVAINLAAMADRSLRRRARALLRLGPPPLVPELSPELLDLRDALAALPLGQRQVIVLHHLVGLPVEEVAGAAAGATSHHTVAQRWGRRRCTAPSGSPLRTPPASTRSTSPCAAAAGPAPAPGGLVLLDHSPR
jgi:RNA polymerase sigma-70 factor, ECF subfamily